MKSGMKFPVLPFFRHTRRGIIAKASGYQVKNVSQRTIKRASNDGRDTVIKKKGDEMVAQLPAQAFEGSKRWNVRYHMAKKQQCASSSRSKLAQRHQEGGFGFSQAKS